jgi:hypothetical protein
LVPEIYQDGAEHAGLLFFFRRGHMVQLLVARGPQPHRPIPDHV